MSWDERTGTGFLRYNSHHTTGSAIAFSVTKSAGITAPVSQTVWSAAGGVPAAGTGATFLTSYTTVGMKTVSATLDDLQGDSSKVHTASTRVCLYRVRLDAVTFGGAGYHDVYHDVGTQQAYEKPHWGPTRQNPVSYRRNTRPTVDEARWTVEPPEGFEGTNKVLGSGSYLFPETTATLTQSTLVAGNMISYTSFTNAIAYVNPLTVNWYIHTATDEWLDGKRNDNPVYVTLATPQGTAFHTCLHIGCTNAGGRTEATPAAQDIWGEFTDRIVWRAEQPVILSYYAGGFAHTTATTTADLLKCGNGQCGSWADFLRDCWRVQGINNGRLVQVTANIPLADGFIVNNWTFAATGPSTPTAPYTYLLNRDVLDAKGAPGQNNPDPESVFVRHYIVRYGNNYDDPSYGTGPFSSQLQWETGSLAGFFAKGDHWGRPQTELYVKRDDPNTTETLFSE